MLQSVRNWKSVRNGCFLGLIVGFACAAWAAGPTLARSASDDPRLQKSYRFQQAGWTYVHLEGSPSEIGFQHGYLLAPEIADAFEATKLLDMRESHRDWAFFRQAAQDMLWPHIDGEYQRELQGIADGLKAHGVTVDVYDVVALNAFEELSEYYVPWLDKSQKGPNAPRPKPPGNCSAFIATGSQTKGGQIVIAHNDWTSYMAGERSVIIFDIVTRARQSHVDGRLSGSDH